MSSLIGSLIQRVLTKYLSEYFTYGKLEVKGIGEYHLLDLELKPEIIPANLAVKIRTCSLEEVYIKVSPLQLFSLSASYAISVQVKTLKVVLEERPEKEWDETAEFEALKAAKLALAQQLRDEALQSIETKLASLDGSLVPDTSESSIMGLVKNLAVRFAGNFELEVSQLEMAYHFEGADRSGHVGLRVENFRLENTTLSPRVEVARQTSAAQDSREDDLRIGDDADLAPIAAAGGSTIGADAEGEVAVAGILVEPVQGATERIVKKQISIDGIEVYLQRNVAGGPSTRTKLVRRFNAESVLAVNLASDPRPTLGIVELRVSRVCIGVSPKDLAALTYLGESLTHQVRWKLWCAERFSKLVQTGITTQDQTECFKVYEEMFKKGKQDVGPRTRAPKKLEVAASGVESLLADLSWIHQRELRCHPETIRTILESVASIAAKRERQKIEDQIKKGQQPSVTKRISGAASSWLGWATGSASADDADAPRVKTEDEIREMAKSAQDLSAALGVTNETNIDPKKLRKHRRKIFDSIDKDKSGSVDVVELQVGLAMAGTTLSPKKVQELISTFDTNLDGSIDFDEFCTMCDLAPGRLGGVAGGEEGAGTQSKPDVLALSVTVQSFEAVLYASDPDAAAHSPPARVVATLNEICTAIAVEGAMNPMVGLRGINFGVRRVDVDLFNGNDKLPLLAPRGFVTRKSSALETLESRDGGDHDDDDEDPEERMDLAESRFRVRVLSLKLAENDVAPTLSPYCALYYLDEYEDTLDEQTTGLVDGSTHKFDGDGLAEYDFKPQNPVVPPLEFIVGHGRKPRKAHVQIQVRQRQDNSGWMRRLVRQRVSSVDPVENDLVLCAVDVHLPVRGIPKDEFSRIGNHMYRDFEEWYELPGGFGKVRLRVECMPSGPSTVRAAALPLATPKSAALSTLFEFEAIANQSVMYFDVASGLTVPRFYVNLHPELLPWTDKISEAYAAESMAAHTWAKESGADGPNATGSPSWRCEKILLDVGVVEIQGLDASKKTRVVSTRIVCGSERLGHRGELQNEATLTLGETQNLFQLEALQPEARVELSFELSTKRTATVDSLTLTRVLADVRNGRRSLLLWCKTTEPNIRVRVSIDVSSPDFDVGDDGNGAAEADLDEEAKGKTADELEPTLAMPPSWQQQGHMAGDPPQAEWAKWVQADPFGLMTFPPILHQNIAYLNIQVISARGLRAADFNGKSDPYCVLNCHSQESRTHVVPKTLNPSWEDKPQTSQFKFGPLPGSALDPSSFETLDLRVMDEDFGGEWTHDLLGVAHVPLHDLYEKIVRAPNEAQEHRLSENRLKRRNTSKRYSQRPASRAEINPDRNVTMWIPLHMQDSAAPGAANASNDEPDGAVQVRLWLEPCGEVRRPQSVIPVAVDMTMLLDVAMPAIRIPKNHELNASRKTIEISLGRPSMSMRVNSGASDSLVSALRIHTDHEEALRALRAKDPGLQEQLTTIKDPKLRAAQRREQEQKQDKQGQPRPGLRTHKSSQSSALEADNDSGFYSISERPKRTESSGMPTNASVATNLDDFHSIATAEEEREEEDEGTSHRDAEPNGAADAGTSGREKKPKRARARRKVPKSVMTDLDFGFGFYVDCFEVRVGFVRGRKEVRDFFLLAAEGFCMDMLYSLYDCGLPLIKLSVQADRFQIEDRWQGHPIIGDHLVDVYPELENNLSDMELRRLRKLRERLETPQFRLSLVYQRDAAAEDQRQELGSSPVPSLVFGMDLEGMYVLVTPLIDFGTKVASAFGLLDETGVSQPETVTEIQQATGNSGNEQAQEPPSAQKKDAASAATVPGSVLPVSKVRVLICTNRVELHVMRRQTLCLESRRRLHKYPPKSLILRLSSEITYSCIARPFQKDPRALPGSETVKLRATCDARLAPTKIDRHCFQQIPDDLFSGDNIILEPFTFNLTMKTNSIDAARDLRLAHRLRNFDDSEASASQGNLDEFFANSSGSHFEVSDNALDNEEKSAGGGSRQSRRQSTDEPAGQIRDLRAEDIWGVNSYTVLAQQKMRDELHRAKGDRFETVRIIEIRLDGLETRLDTGDIVFLREVAMKQMEMVAALYPDQSKAQDASATAGREHAESVMSRHDSVASEREHAESTLSTRASESNISYPAGNGAQAKEDPVRILTESDIRLMTDIKSNVMHGDDDNMTEYSDSSDEELKVGDPGLDDLGTALEGCEKTEAEKEAAQPGTYTDEDYRALENKGEQKSKLFNAEDAAPNPHAKRTDGTQSLLPAWLLAGMVPMLVMCSDTEAFRRRLPGDLPGHWNTERDAEVLGALSEQAARDATLDRVFDQINVYVNQLMLGVGNNLEGYPTPFVRLSLAQFNLIGCSRTFFSDDMEIRGYVSTTSTSYNTIVRAWEPLIEPWSLLLQAENSDATTGRLFQAIAPRRLNLNITDAFLRSMVSFMGSLDPTYTPLDDERLHGMYTPNWVVNETGHALELWPVNHPGRQMHSVEPQLLTYRQEKQLYLADNGEALRLHLHDTTRIRAKMAELLHHMRENKRRLVFKTVKYLRNTARRHREERENDPGYNKRDEREKQASFMRKFAKDDMKEAEEHAEREEDLRKDLTELFHFMDEDGSGEISCVELQNALSHYGEPISVEEVLYSIGEMDDEGVENVDAAETGIDLREFLDFFMPSLLETSSKPAPGLDVHAIGFRVQDLEGTGDDGSQSRHGLEDLSAQDGTGRDDPVVQVPLAAQIGIAPSENAGQFMLQTASVVTLGQHETQHVLSGGKGSKHADSDSASHQSSGNEDTYVAADDDEDDDVDDDEKLDPAQSPEDDEAQREERRRTKRLTASQLKGRDQRSYEFIDRSVKALSVVANVQKIGRSSAGDVLFLETPIRVENRTIVPLRINFVCYGADGTTLYEDAMFTLSPGDEQSIPLKYLYARQMSHLQGGDCGFSVSPIMDRAAQQRLWFNKRGELQKQDTKRRSRTLSVDSTHSNRSSDSAYDDWTDSPVLVDLQGGQGLRVRQPFRAQDDLLDSKGDLLNDLLVNGGAFSSEDLESDIVGATRVAFHPRPADDDDDGGAGISGGARSGHGQRQSNVVALEDLDELDDAEQGRDLSAHAPQTFECVMLTQRNALNLYEMKEILTVQVLQASNLMASDANNSSDPFVIVSSLDGKMTVEKFKTPVIRKTLNPIWANKSTFRFGEGKEPLSRQRRLRFSVVDWDALTSNDPLGYVTLDMKEIVSWFSAGHAVKTARGVIKKTFMLEAGRGVSEKEVKGSLTVEFSYKRYAAATGTPKQYLQHVFSFYPPLILENLMPYPVELALEVLKAEGNDEVVSRHKVRLGKGGLAPFHEMDGALLDYLDPMWVRHHSARSGGKFRGPNVRSLSSQDGLTGQIRVRMLMDDGPTAWSDPLDSNTLGIPLMHGSLKDRPVCSISAEVERKPMQDGGGRRLVICAPFWAINRTDLVLDWTVALDDKKKKLELAQTKLNIWDHAPQTVTPFYAPGKQRRIYTEARLSKDPQAARFTASSSQCIMDDESRELQTGLSVYVPLFASRLPGPECFPSVEMVVMAAQIKGLDEEAPAVGLSCTVEDAEGSNISKTAYTAAIPGGSSRKWPFASGFLSVTVPASSEHEPAHGNLVFTLREVSERSAMPAAAIVQSMTGAGGGAGGNGDDGDANQGGNMAANSISASTSSQSSPANAFDSLYSRNPSSHRVLGEARISLPEIIKELLVQGKVQRAVTISRDTDTASNAIEVRLQLSLAGVPMDERLVSLYSSLSAVVNDPPFRRDIGVSLTPLLGSYSRTSLLTIGPKYRVANVTEEPLLVKQGGCPDCTAVLLRPRDAALHSDPNDLSDVKVFCFHYQLTPGTRFQVRDDPSRKVYTATDCVQVRLATADGIWSEPIKMEGLDDFALQLRAGPKMERAARVWVDANEVLPAQMLIFRTLDVDEVDHTVRNTMKDRSFEVVQIPSRSIGIRAAMKRCFKPLPGAYKLLRNAFPPDLVGPESEVSLPLDLPPEEGLRTHILVIPLREDGSRDVDYAKAIRYKPGLVVSFPQRHGGELALGIHTYGLRSSVVISEMTRKARKKAAQADGDALEHFVEKLTPRRPQYEFLLEISSSCVSLFSSRRGLEVLYVCAQRVHIEGAMETFEDRGAQQRTIVTCEFAVGHFQIDSSQVQAKYPVMMFARPPKAKAVRASESEPILCAVSKLATERTLLLSQGLRRNRAINDYLRVQAAYEYGGASSSFDIVKLLTLSMHKMEVKIDSVLLAGVFNILSPILSGGTEESGSIEGEGAVLGLEQDESSFSSVGWIVDMMTNGVTIPAQDTVFCERIRVSPTAFITSVNLGSSSDLEETLRQFGIPMAFYGIIKRFSRLDNFSFDLSQGHYEAITSHKFQTRYINKIIRAVLSQMHEYFINQGKQLIPFLHSKHHHEKIREPLVPSGGVLVQYGPGPKPSIIESEREKSAAEVVERSFLQYLERKRNGFPAGMRPQQTDDGTNKASKKSCLGCGA